MVQACHTHRRVLDSDVKWTSDVAAALRCHHRCPVIRRMCQRVGLEYEICQLLMPATWHDREVVCADHAPGGALDGCVHRHVARAAPRRAVAGCRPSGMHGDGHLLLHAMHAIAPCVCTPRTW